jgi:branched-chain amino acid transport system ATP-binding protein
MLLSFNTFSCQTSNQISSRIRIFLHDQEDLFMKPVSTTAINTVPLLETTSLTKAFKGLIALQGHTLRVNAGELIGVIGPNGSGKSTLFNVISGFLPPTSGTVKLEGKDISGLESANISRLGIARTFQGTRLFKNLSVLENVRVSAQLRQPINLAQALFGGMTTQAKAIDETALELLDLVRLTFRQHDKAGSLPYGDQRRLEIARALATRPKLLMLDEPAAGLDSSETRALLELIQKIRSDYNLAVIVIEHDMELIMNLCERIQVLAYGQTIGEGTPKEVQTNPRVREAYLGASEEAA